MFVETGCRSCGETGKSFDSTNQDKVFVGPFPGRCDDCRGAGYVLRNPEIVDNFVKPASDPAGDIPDWMC